VITILHILLCNVKTIRAFQLDFSKLVTGDEGHIGAINKVHIWTSGIDDQTQGSVLRADKEDSHVTAWSSGESQHAAPPEVQEEFQIDGPVAFQERIPIGGDVIP